MILDSIDKLNSFGDYKLWLIVHKFIILIIKISSVSNVFTVVFQNLVATNWGTPADST